MLVVLFILMLRWTLPRFRFDQLMSLAWKGLIPLALANLVGVAVILSLDGPRWLLLPISIALFVAGGMMSAQQFQRAGSARPTSGRSLVQQGVS
jgi:NADH-quinone oxidoreductase subunit H